MNWQITKITKNIENSNTKFIVSFIVSNNQKTISSDECVDEKNMDLMLKNNIEENAIKVFKSSIGNDKVVFYENKLSEIKNDEINIDIPWS